jgi:hypothetical protein
VVAESGYGAYHHEARSTLVRFAGELSLSRRHPFAALRFQP